MTADDEKALAVAMDKHAMEIFEGFRGGINWREWACRPSCWAPSWGAGAVEGGGSHFKGGQEHPGGIPAVGDEVRRSAR